MAPKRVRRTRSLVVSRISSKVRARGPVTALAVGLACLLSPLVNVPAQGVPAMDTLDETLRAPLFKPAAAGPPLDLAGLYGTPVLLHFWATWCGPCRRELPQLAAPATEANQRDFRVVLVAVKGDTTPAMIAAFANGLGPTQPIYLADASGLSPDYWTWGIPVTYLIDSHGHLRGRWLGPREWHSAAVKESLKSLGD